MGMIDKVLRKLLHVSCFILSVSVTILMVAEIAARHLFEHGFRGLPEIYLLLVMWLYMLGASLASANRSHLRIGIMDHLITSARVRQIYQVSLNVISFIIMLFFIRWAWGLVDWGIKRPQTTPILYLPWLIPMVSIFVASILIASYSLRDLFLSVTDFISNPTKVSDAEEG